MPPVSYRASLSQSAQVSLPELTEQDEPGIGRAQMFVLTVRDRPLANLGNVIANREVGAGYQVDIVHAHLPRPNCPADFSDLYRVIERITLFRYFSRASRGAGRDQSGAE